MNKPYRPTTDVSSDFPKKEVAKMGLKLENILSKETLLQKERKLLDYAKTYIEMRKCRDDNWNRLVKEVFRKQEEEEIRKENLKALGFWLRGSRNHINELLPEKELDVLYEKIKSKLKNNPP